MALTITLPDDLARRLADQVARVGKPTNVVAMELIRRGLEEIEFENEVDDARHEFWLEQQLKPDHVVGRDS